MGKQWTPPSSDEQVTDTWRPPSTDEVVAPSKKKALELPNGSSALKSGFLTSQPERIELSPAPPAYRNEIKERQQADAKSQEDATRKLLNSTEFADTLANRIQQRQAEIKEIETDPNADYYLEKQAERERTRYKGPITLSDRIHSVTGDIYGGLGTMGKGLVRAAGAIEKMIPDAVLGEERVDPFVNKINEYIDRFSDWGKRKGTADEVSDEKKAALNENPINGLISGLAEFAPAIASASRTGGMSFFFNDYEHGYENIDKASREQGLDLSEGQKQLYATAQGAASALLMSHNLHSLLGKGTEKTTKSLIDKISIDAIENMAKSGEDFNGANLRKAITVQLDGVLDRAKNFGIKSAIGTAKSVGDLAALEGAKIATDKLANTATGKQVFNMENQAERMQEAIKTGALFGVAGSLLRAPTMLAKGSPERNSVIESLYNDPSPENLQRIKVEVGNRFREAPEESAEVERVVDQIHSVAQSVPRGLPLEKQVRVTDLVLERKDLEKAKMENEAANKTLDPAFSDQTKVQDEVYQDRIDSINDEIKATALDKPVRYFRDKETGEPMKQFGEDEPEKISENRYYTEKPYLTEERKNEKNDNEAMGEIPDGQENGSEGQRGEQVGQETRQGGIEEVQQENEVSPFKQFEDVVRESASLDEAFDRVREIKGVDREVSQAFRDKYDPNGDLSTKQAFEKFYNEIKEEPTNAISERSVEQSNQPEYSGTTEQQQRVEENRANQEELIPTSENQTGGGNIVEESGAQQVTSLKNADVEAKRKEYGFNEPLPRKGATDAELNAAADKAISEGYDAYDLIERIENNEPIKGWESAVLAKFQGAKEAELIKLNEEAERLSQTASTADFQRLAEQRDAVLNDIMRSYDASERAGTVASDALRARKLAVLRDYSLANILIRTRKDNGGKKLTTEQVNEATREYRDIADKEAAYQAHIEKLKAENATLRAEAAMKKVSRSVRRERRAEKLAEVDKEIDSTFERMRKLANKSRSTLSANPLPVEYVPEIAKLLKQYAKKGIIKAENIIDDIYSKLKDDFEGLSKEHVAEYIDLAAQGDPLKSVKSRMRTTLAKLLKRTEEQDFEPQKRKEYQLDEEGQRLRDAVEKAKYDFELASHRRRLEQQGFWDNARDVASEILNVPRALMATADLSAPGRQGAILTYAHPTLGKKAMAHQLRSWANQKNFDRWFYDLKESADYADMQKAKLYISDPHKPELAAKEEAFMTNLAAKIPVVGDGFKLSEIPLIGKRLPERVGNVKIGEFKIGGKKIGNLGLITRSERAYVAYLNSLRVETFRLMRNQLEADGFTPANSPEVYKGLANFINNATGRGSFSNENLAQSLNLAFFSPRLMASRANMLLNPIWYGKLPKRVRYKALADMGKFVVATGSMLALAYANGAEVELDPRSSDFWKIRVGDKRWDVGAGFSQWFRLAAQVLMNQSKSTSTGDIKDLGGGRYGARSRADVIGGFFRNKLSPVPAYLYNYADEKDSMGKPFDPVEAIPNNLLPLVWQDTWKAIEQDGVGSAASTFVPAMFGVGVQSYSDIKEPKPPKVEDKLTLSTGKKIPLTPKQVEERTKLNEAYLKEEGERLSERFRKMAERDKTLQEKIRSDAVKFKRMGRDAEYLDKQREAEIQDYINKHLSKSANKATKRMLIKKYGIKSFTE